MRRESIGARGIDERRSSRSRELGLWFPGNIRQDESQRKCIISGPADAREEQICIVATCTKQQCDQSKGKMLRNVT